MQNRPGQINLDLIRTKLKYLESYLKDLETIKPKDLQEYLKDRRNSLSVERLFQLIVECATDINGHILSKVSSKPPATYRESFSLMFKQKILDRSDELTYYEYIRIRNALVHDYNNIDEEKIFSRITPFMALFHKYFTAIRAYINRIEKNTKKTPR